MSCCGIFEFKCLLNLVFLSALIAFDLIPIIIKNGGSMKDGKIVTWIKLAFLYTLEKAIISDRISEGISFSNDLVIGFISSVKKIGIEDDWDILFVKFIVLNMN